MIFDASDISVPLLVAGKVIQNVIFVNVFYKSCLGGILGVIYGLCEKIFLRG